MSIVFWLILAFYTLAGAGLAKYLWALSLPVDAPMRTPVVIYNAEYHNTRRTDYVGPV